VGIYAAPSLTAASDDNLDDQAEAAAQQAAALPKVILGQQPGEVLTRAEIVVNTLDWVNEFQAAASLCSAAAWNSLTQSTTISARVSTFPGCWPKMTWGKK